MIPLAIQSPYFNLFYTGNPTFSNGYFVENVQVCFETTHGALIAKGSIDLGRGDRQMMTVSIIDCKGCIQKGQHPFFMTTNSSEMMRVIVTVSRILESNEKIQMGFDGVLRPEVCIERQQHEAIPKSIVNFQMRRFYAIDIAYENNQFYTSITA